MPTHVTPTHIIWGDVELSSRSVLSHRSGSDMTPGSRSNQGEKQGNQKKLRNRRLLLGEAQLTSANSGRRESANSWNSTTDPADATRQHGDAGAVTSTAGQSGPASVVERRYLVHREVMVKLICATERESKNCLEARLTWDHCNQQGYCGGVRRFELP